MVLIFIIQPDSTRATDDDLHNASRGISAALLPWSRVGTARWPNVRPSSLCRWQQPGRQNGAVTRVTTHPTVATVGSVIAKPAAAKQVQAAGMVQAVTRIG